MRNLRPAILGMMTLGVILAASQSAAAQFNNHKKVLGYQDEDGTFHPMPRTSPDVATLAPITGKITINFVIKIKTALPSGTKIYCGADLIAISTNELSPLESADYTEEAASEGTATACSVTINYSWLMAPASTTVLNSLVGTYTVIAVNPTIPTLVEAVGSRETTGRIPELSKVPATGTTTPPITVDVTL